MIAVASPGVFGEGANALRLVLGTALDAAIVMRSDGTIADWNHLAALTFGWSREEAIGRSLAELVVPPRFRDEHRRGLQRYLATGENRLIGRRVEIWAVRRSGEEFPVELSVAPLPGQGEAMFVGFVRDISDRQRTQVRLARQAREMTLLYRVTALAAETRSFDDALRACLMAVCQLTGWPAGHVYLPSGGQPVELLPSGIWYAEQPERYAAFRAVTERTRMAAGQGLPGKIWQTGEPFWIADVDRSSGPVIVRSAKRPDPNVRSAFGFPIKNEGKIIAILEFFSDVPTEPDVNLLRTLRAIGEQVGRVFERKRAEDLLREQTQALETINRINSSLAGELNLERLVQAVTDAATAVTGAACGAFFYNARDEAGEGHLLHALSGASRSDLEAFPVPRDSALFRATFAGEGVMRLDDVARDARHGPGASEHGMLPGQLPVRSYLAVPVVSRSGAVVGGLFFGHPRPGAFNERHEKIVGAIAVQAAIGIDNARVYRRAETELAERRKIEQHQALLVAELNHRVKNMLAVVMGIASQTARTSRSIDAFTDSFLGRLSSLARAHTLLTAQNWNVMPLKAVIDQVLAPYADAHGSRFAFDGPEVRLGPKAAVAVSMILHELVTNAAKYGALSKPAGRLSVVWSTASTDGGEQLRLCWREDGLTGLKPPKRHGFGTRLVDVSTRHELGGKAVIAFRDTGVQYDIEFPLQT